MCACVQCVCVCVCVCWHHRPAPLPLINDCMVKQRWDGSSRIQQPPGSMSSNKHSIFQINFALRPTPPPLPSFWGSQWWNSAVGLDSPDISGLCLLCCFCRAGIFSGFCISLSLTSSWSLSRAVCPAAFWSTGRSRFSWLTLRSQSLLVQYLIHPLVHV